MQFSILLATLLIGMGWAPLASAQVQTFTDETAFMNALTAASLQAIHEGFESDLDWGHVRTTVVGGYQLAHTVAAQGITWSANHLGSDITTGPGPARTGQWGFFQIPHGDPVAGIRDGWMGTTAQPMVAIGGWIQSTGSGSIELRLDGVPVDFGGNSHTTSTPQFFGAIQLAGFSQFEWEELEAAPGDWKYLFADDFTFAFGGTIIDCNQNGLGDALDIAQGTSTDCNGNHIPDECEILQGSSAPGGPFFCQSGCDPDCNQNGILDACEVIDYQEFLSGALGPVGSGTDLTFTIPGPPQAMGPVVVELSAHANLGGSDEYLEVRLNGQSLGNAFEWNGSDCPSPDADFFSLAIPANQFELWTASGSAVWTLTPSQEVDAGDCSGASWVSFAVRIPRPSALDINADGVPDSCESLGTIYCTPGQPNSAHPEGASITAVGSGQASLNQLAFSVEGLPPNQFTLLINGEAAANVPFPAGSLGILCLGGSIGRHKEDLAFSGPQGMTQIPVDLTQIPTPSVPITLQAGETRYFQAWYRDFWNGSSQNNFSDAVEVLFY